MYVCPCIIYENDERYQLDATNLFIIINNLNNFTCFGHLYAQYVGPCIIYENDERYQLDATNLFIIINKSTCFRHLYARNIYS